MVTRLTHYLRIPLLMLGFCALGSSWAAAPGEDPVVLNKRVTVQMQPLGTETKSGYIEHDKGMSAWQQARITRYVAKAFSGDTTGVTTEKDVVQAVETKGGKTVCSQSVGSNVSSGAATNATKTGDQIVVLRGDLVNICW